MSQSPADIVAEMRRRPRPPTGMPPKLPKFGIAVVDLAATEYEQTALTRGEASARLSRLLSFGEKRAAAVDVEDLANHLEKGLPGTPEGPSQVELVEWEIDRLKLELPALQEVQKRRYDTWLSVLQEHAAEVAEATAQALTSTRTELRALLDEAVRRVEELRALTGKAKLDVILQGRPHKAVGQSVRVFLVDRHHDAHAVLQAIGEAIGEASE